jgi:hypothetical protein
VIGVIILILLRPAVQVDVCEREYPEEDFGQAQRIQEELASLFVFVPHLKFPIPRKTTESQKPLLRVLVQGLLNHIVLAVETVFDEDLVNHLEEDINVHDDRLVESYGGY